MNSDFSPTHCAETISLGNRRRRRRVMWAQYCMAGSIPRTSSVPRVFPHVSVSNRETLNGCQIKVFSKVYDVFTIATCTHRLAHSSGIGRVVSDKLKWDKNTPLSYIVKLLLFKDESDVIIALRHNIIKRVKLLLFRFTNYVLSVFVVPICIPSLRPLCRNNSFKYDCQSKLGKCIVYNIII